MSWQDPVLLLAQDPNLLTTKERLTQLSEFINGLAERRISKLCSQGVAILKLLEKINAQFRTWEFMLMDYNLDRHFGDDHVELQLFNEGIAERVMDACKQHQKKLHYISVDIDNLTKISRLLTPVEYMSDLGALLTSLVLRSIRTKNEVQERTTVAYSKAKLILIGKELDEIAEPDVLQQYKLLLGQLIKQLNEAIDANDAEAKFECLAVISDMEQMFEEFKAEHKEKTHQQQLVRMRDLMMAEDFVDLGFEEEPQFPHDPYDIHDPENYKPLTPRLHQTTMFDDDYSEYNSMYSTTPTAPLVQSITKTTDQRFPRLELIHLMESQQLYRTSITEEMPYLMLAFSLAKNFEEDVHHYQKDAKREQKPQPQPKPKPKLRPVLVPGREHPPLIPRSLADSALYQGLTLLRPLPPSLLGNNNTNPMLARFGIKPQVIKVDIAEGKENKVTKVKPQHTPLTKENLQSLDDLVD